MTSDSLLASSRRLPARAAASVDAQAGGADDRRHDVVGFAAASRLRSSAACTAQHARPVRRLAQALRSSSRAASRSASTAYCGRHAQHLLGKLGGIAVARPSATTRKRSGMAARAHRACSRRSSPWSRARQRRSCRDSRCTVRPNSSTGAAPVTLSMRSITPPCPGNRRAAVLQPGKAFEQALGQIADDRERHHEPGTAARSCRTRHVEPARCRQCGDQRAQRACRRARLPRSCRAIRAARAAPAEARGRRKTRRCRPPTRAAARTASSAAPRGQIERSRTSASHAGTSASNPAKAADHGDARCGAQQRSRQARAATRPAADES